jgi:hypothetical protein
MDVNRAMVVAVEEKPESILLENDWHTTEDTQEYLFREDMLHIVSRPQLRPPRR